MKKMLYFVVLGCFVVPSQKLFSQVGIGTTSVEDNLLLKVHSANKGVLLPNLTISNLSVTNPVTNPAYGLLAYNKSVGKEGFTFWDGVKWNELVDSRNVYSVLGITISYSTSNSAPKIIDIPQGPVLYTENSAPGTIWSEVQNLSKNITITQTNNSIVVITEGMVQANNSVASSSNSFTYAVGIFIDGKLAGVRNYSTRYSNVNQYDYFSINSVLQNLSVGNHNIKTYVTVRANDYPSATQWKFGGAVGVASINDEMAKINMYIKLTEKS